MRGAILALAMTALPGAGWACIVPVHTQGEMPETIVEHGGTGIYRAWFDGPTTRYAHGVLGDAIEATELWAEAPTAANSCSVLNVRLDEAHVFEDVAPRLLDLDGDGAAELIVVRSHRDLGAQLAIYGDAGDGAGLALIAATPYIGRSNRWLAPIGAADLDGDGMIEIAYIDRPHLARTLRVWRYVPGGLAGQGHLAEVASAGGLTNHRIGDPTIPGGIRDCGQGPEMVTADAGWSRVIATRLLPDGGLAALDIGPWTAGALNAALACPD